MHVLYIHQYFATRRGRTGTRSYEQAKAMLAAGHRVTVLTSSAQLLPEEVPLGTGDLRRGTIDGIDVIVLVVPYDQRMSYARRVLAFLTFMAKACRIVLTEPGVDLIYATTTPLTVGVPALLGWMWQGTPYAFEVRDLWPEIPVALGIVRNKFLVGALAAFERACYQHARFLVAVNEDVGGRMSRTAGGRREVVVVPNACDTDLFSPRRDGSVFRRTHDLEGKVLCAHTGAMGPVNGLGAILDAAAALREDRTLCFVFIGAGNQRPALEERARLEGLDNVRFLDSLPKTQLADALATADIGLMTVAPLPVLELNCANKFFDYLASGLPVVLNYGGWQGRLLERNACGLGTPQGDTPAFIEAVRRLAHDPARRREMAANARRLAEGLLDRRQVVVPLLRAIEAVRLAPPGHCDA